MWHTGPILRALWRNKVGALLVVIQMALTLAIVSNALTIIDQRQALIARPTGMADSELFSLNAYPSVKQPLDQGKVQQDLDKIRELPGVIDATLINQIPMSGSGSSSGFRTADANPDGQHVPAAVFNGGTNILNVMGLKLVKGRDFTPADYHVSAYGYTQDAPAVIITQQLADELFPGKDPIGQSITRDSGLMEVVGVVQTMLGSWPEWNHAGNAVITPDFITDLVIPHYLIRTKAGSRSEVMGKVQDLLLKVDPNRVILTVRTMDEWKHRVYAQDIVMVGVLKACITILAMITALGITGLTVFWVNQRRKQVGTRRALGATKAAIVRYFLVENGIISVVATLVGTGLALALNRLLVQHYQLPALPLGYLLGSLGALVVLGQLSALLPAFKAAQIPPATATRSV
ncbi:ABC transporter permease [Gallaecimonas kandeliae]|uniref:ABC transporter permease n=1 Tax=Gallaecimonas kandeliae TaxID=3029055 RepID=UPI0026499ECB|nr:FtsX-like permease family protein [Gallaecimonas kandeliae]WKE65420.1 ABC transporter permease [Gallaecimonas kandeliae]